MNSSSEIPVIEQLDAILSAEAGTFAQYQDFPPVARRRIPALATAKYRPTQIGLDAPRYAWLQRHFHQEGAHVVDVGGSLGYFALSLIADLGATALLVEPIAAYCRASEVLARGCGLHDRLRTEARGLPLRDARALEEADLVVHLNVLHHAGTIFDHEAVAEAGSWDAYAHLYLQALSMRARALFFQTGNVSAGPAHFPGEQGVPFVASLLARAGWDIIAIGVIEDFDRLAYVNYRPDQIGQITPVHCRRDASTGLVDYVRGGELVASLPKGIAQRPLWFCRSRNYR